MLRFSKIICENSKIGSNLAYVRLERYLSEAHFGLIDSCQSVTHSRPIPRRKLLKDKLSTSLNSNKYFGFITTNRRVFYNAGQIQGVVIRPENNYLYDRKVDVYSTLDSEKIGYNTLGSEIFHFFFKFLQKFNLQKWLSIIPSAPTFLLKIEKILDFEV